MKHRLTISLTLVLILLASIAASHSPGQAQTGGNARRSSLNSGLIPLTQTQFVRLSLANATTNPNAGDKRTARVRAVIVDFAPNAVQGGVTEYNVAGQRTAGPNTLRPGQGASMDFDLSQASRADVTSFYIIVEALPFAGSNDAAACTATLTIYDKLTNQPLSVWGWAEADGGYVWM